MLFIEEHSLINQENLGSSARSKGIYGQEVDGRMSWVPRSKNPATVTWSYVRLEACISLNT